MKFQLVLMRHGQAQSQHLEGDFMRSLTKRGEEQVVKMAEKLEKLGWKPEYGLYSAAKRTEETQKMLASVWGQGNWESFRSLYLADMHHIEETILGLTLADVQSLILIGHNPGWSDAVFSLSRNFCSLGTAESALLSIEASSWSEAIMDAGKWNCEQIIRSEY